MSDYKTNCATLKELSQQKPTSALGMLCLEGKKSGEQLICILLGRTFKGRF